MILPVHLCIVDGSWILYFPGVFVEWQCSRQWLREVQQPKVLPESSSAKPIILSVRELHDKSVSGRGCLDEVKAHNWTTQWRNSVSRVYFVAFALHFVDCNFVDIEWMILVGRNLHVDSVVD